MSLVARNYVGIVNIKSTRIMALYLCAKTRAKTLTYLIFLIMALFIRTFIRIFAFFLAISVFFFLIATLINFTMINEKNHNNFVFKEGDKKSNNKIALLKLNGPILIDPPSYINFSFFNNLEIIYANNIKKLLDNLSNEKINGLIVSINSPGGSVSGSYKLYNLQSKFELNLSDIL